MKIGRVVDTKHQPQGLREGKPDYTPLEYDINFKDILLMGIQKEEASVRFYVDMAEMITDAGSRELLLELAEEEVGHKERFQAALNRLYQDT
jgi:rubrerythrin